MNPIPQSAILNPSLYLSRRDMLARSGTGFGAIALAGLLQQDALRASPLNPEPRTLNAGGQKPGPHLPPRAKSIIFLFMEGGPSHLDTFDPKAGLEKPLAQPLPASFKPVILAMGEKNPPIMPSKRKWAQHGAGGLWVSDWLPHMATWAADPCRAPPLHSGGA